MPFDETIKPFPAAAFTDILEANDAFAATFEDQNLAPSAARELAVVTCMDSRINPLAVLGMQAGDVKILRNAGARVTQDVLRTLVIAGYLLNVKRVLIMPHTNCKMASATENDIHRAIAEEYDVDTRSLEFGAVEDQLLELATDVIRVRAYPLMPAGTIVGGAIYDVKTGRLSPVDI